MPTFTSFYWTNPNLPGLTVLMGGLAALGWATAPSAKRAGERESEAPVPTFRADNSAIAVATLLMGGAALFKVFIGLQAGLAVALACLFVAPASRRTLLRVVVGLGLFALLLAFVYRHTFEAPNQHARFELLTELRASGWFVPVALGFRILGLGELFGLPWRGRTESPLRVAVACLVATGLVGLFLRISAEQMTGGLGYNNGVWIAVVAKVPMWLLVLGAIQRWPLGPTGRAVAVSIVTVGAVWGSVPYMRLISSPEAIAPHWLTPDDVEVPRWLEQTSPPGTVVACDSTYPLHLTALTPCRAPCPQGLDFAFSISFMTVAEQGRRVADAEQFWAEWYCGEMPREYLGKYGVRWIVAPADFSHPEGARCVFANGSWAIYEAVPFNSVDLAER